MNTELSLLTLTSTSFAAGFGLAGFIITLEVMPWLPILGFFGAIAAGEAFGMRTQINTIQELNEMK